VLTIHDNGFLEEHRGLKRWLMKKIWLDWPLKRCNRVVAVSNATKRSILEHTDYPEDQIEVIHSVVPSHFKPREVLPNNPKPVLLHIGLAPNKNLKGHAEAIQGMDVLLRIIGEPSEADHAMLQSLGIDYEWKSGLSDEEMQEAYATSDLLLFCSTLEGFGMPILEAKAVGLPVITSDIEPMNEVGKGWATFAPPFNSKKLRRTVLNVLHSERNEVGSLYDCAQQEAAESHEGVYRQMTFQHSLTL
jgi:glycosyltransferase involved in cell wall biosynthesis